MDLAVVKKPTTTKVLQQAGKKIDKALERAGQETGKLMERAGEAMQKAGENLQDKSK